MRTGTKTHAEKEDEAIEDGVRMQPKDLPPREDLRKHKIPEADPDLKKDPDMSLNYKDSAYHGPPGHLTDHDPVAPEHITGVHHWDYKDVRDLTFQDYDKIISAAQRLVDPELMQYNRDVAYRQALDYAIWSYGHGVYDHKIAAPMYDILLNRISGTETNLAKNTLLDCDINRGMKFAHNLLNSSEFGELDPVLRSVISQLLKAKTPKSEKMAKRLHDIRMTLADCVDCNADEPYMEEYKGKTVVKERDPNEPYMDLYNNPGPYRQDADEKYMRNFTDKRQ